MPFCTDLVAHHVNTSRDELSNSCFCILTRNSVATVVIVAGVHRATVFLMLQCDCEDVTNMI